MYIADVYSLELLLEGGALLRLRVEIAEKQIKEFAPEVRLASSFLANVSEQPPALWLVVPDSWSHGGLARARKERVKESVREILRKAEIISPRGEKTISAKELTRYRNLIRLAATEKTNKQKTKSHNVKLIQSPLPLDS